MALSPECFVRPSLRPQERLSILEAAAQRTFDHRYGELPVVKREGDHFTIEATVCVAGTPPDGSKGDFSAKFDGFGRFVEATQAGYVRSDEGYGYPVERHLGEARADEALQVVKVFLERQPR